MLINFKYIVCIAWKFILIFFHNVIIILKIIFLFGSDLSKHFVPFLIFVWQIEDFGEKELNMNSKNRKITIKGWLCYFFPNLDSFSPLWSFINPKTTPFAPINLRRTPPPAPAPAPASELEGEAGEILRPCPDLSRS